MLWWSLHIGTCCKKCYTEQPVQAFTVAKKHQIGFYKFAKQAGYDQATNHKVTTWCVLWPGMVAMAPGLDSAIS